MQEDHALHFLEIIVFFLRVGSRPSSVSATSMSATHREGQTCFERVVTFAMLFGRALCRHTARASWKLCRPRLLTSGRGLFLEASRTHARTHARARTCTHARTRTRTRTRPPQPRRPSRRSSTHRTPQTAHDTRCQTQNPLCHCPKPAIVLVPHPPRQTQTPPNKQADTAVVHTAFPINSGRHVFGSFSFSFKC